MAKKVASARVHTPPPANSTTNSATAMPTTTPINSRTAFDPLRPRVTLRPTMAAIGAKKGSGCPANRTAITHAATAAAVFCAIGQTEPAHRRSTVSIIRCTPWSIRQVGLFCVCAVEGRQPSTGGFRRAGDITLDTRLRPYSALNFICSEVSAADVYLGTAGVVRRATAGGIRVTLLAPRRSGPPPRATPPVPLPIARPPSTLRCPLLSGRLLR